MTILTFPVQNFISIPYRDGLTATPIWLLTSSAAQNNQGQQVSTGHQSKVVNTAMDWGTNDYLGQSATIIFQNNNGGSAQLLDKILMVYVDNVNNPSDVTLYFPDSGMFLTVPSGSCGYYPVFTQVWTCVVYNGYSGVQENGGQGTQQTQIIFCNFAVPGFLAQTSNVISQQAAFATGLISTSIGSIPMPVPAGSIEIYAAELGVSLYTNVVAGQSNTNVSLGGAVINGIADGTITALGFRQTAAAVGLFTPIGILSRVSLSTPMVWNSLGGIFITVDPVQFTNIAVLSVYATLWYNTTSSR